MRASNRRWGEVEESGYILHAEAAGFLDTLTVRNERKREIKDDTKAFSPGRMELLECVCAPIYTCMCIYTHVCMYVCVYLFLDMMMSTLM